MDFHPSDSTANLYTRIDQLLTDERPLDALNLATAHGDWTSASSATDLIVAARLAGYCGGEQLSRRLSRKALALDPTSPRAIYGFAIDRLRRHGAYEALRWLDTTPLASATAPTSTWHADILALRARILGYFRDFSTADQLLTRALEAFPDHGWLWMEKSDLLRAQDRYDDALVASETMIGLAPTRSWSVRTLAHLLQLSQRDNEAIALLENACARTQSGYLALQLAAAYEEAGNPARVLEIVELAETRLPLAEKNDRQWINARRCDAFHRLGRDEEALAAAKAAAPSGNGYYSKIAARLALPVEPTHHRVHLPVGFVRQHHMTCAPATIAAVAGYWGRKIDHLALAADICYDGTPDHAERAWLEERGWVVRDFTVDWATAVALIDRGCPFLIVTVNVRSAHLQAVIGYDSRLRTLLVRDPYERCFTEWLADGALLEQAPYGPRGTVMLPPDEAGRLSDLPLPDATLHDHWHTLQRALAEFRRTDAENALNTLVATAPNHTLTLRARRSVAQHDRDLAAGLAPTEELHQRFPECVNYQLDLLATLEHLGRTNEARERLARLGAGRSRYFALQRRHAENLAADARSAKPAGLLLRRILRRNATDPESLRSYANFLWGDGRHAEATDLYRLAATSADKVEHHWRAYFSALRHQRREEEGLALLQARHARWGNQSDQPARTLFESLDALDRTEEALEVLHDARQRRPRDGGLALHYASVLARLRRFPEADSLLHEAGSLCTPLDWARTAAEVADRKHDHAEALRLWLTVVAHTPSDSGAQEATARLLHTCQGQAAAIAHLEAASAALPHFFPLKRLLVEWLRGDAAERALNTVDGLLAANPNDAWGHRERAVILRRLGRHPEALASAQQALAIEPRSPASHCVLSRCLRDLQQNDPARDAARTGVTLDIDASHLFEDLLLACESREQREDAVRFLTDELLRQVSFNGAVLDFIPHARAVLKPTELVATLRRIEAMQPNHWATRSALATILGESDALPEAITLAEANTARFPLIPRVWLDLANLHKLAKHGPEETTALEHAVALNPSWGHACRCLSAAYERAGQPAKAEAALLAAISAYPADSYNHSWLADLLSRKGQHAEALAALEEAVRCDPNNSDAWTRLHHLSQALNHASRATSLAEELAKTRPGEPAQWIRLVRIRSDASDPAENLQALERAEALAPRDGEIHDLRAEVLARFQRWAEALRACDPPIFNGNAPHFLRGRAAWILAETGDRTTAIKRMNEIVAAVPDYDWGWRQLVGWNAEEGNLDDARQAAEKLAWLNPKDPAPLGWAADLLRRDGHRARARDAFAEALTRHPDYHYAARELLSILLTDELWSDAERLLQHIQKHFGQAEYLSARGRWLSARGQIREAIATLRSLLALPDADGFHIMGLANSLTSRGRGQAVARLAAEQLAATAGNTEATALWLQTQKSRNQFLRAWSFHHLRPAARKQGELVTGYINQLVEKEALLPLLFLKITRGAELRRNQVWWGDMGYALTSFGWFRAASGWMADWPTRENLAPYMLTNLALSHFSLGRPASAVDVLTHAVGLPPDHTHTKITGWLALESALNGDLAGAEGWLAKASPTANRGYDICLHRLARLAVQAQTATSETRSEHSRTLERELSVLATERAHDLNHPSLVRHARRVHQLVAKIGGHRIRQLLHQLGWLRVVQGEQRAFSWWWLFIGFWLVRYLVEIL